MKRSTRCESCQRQILWTLTAKEKKPMPVNPLPAHDGNLVLHEMLDPEYGRWFIFARALKKDVLYDGPLYKSHFATCPNADQHRRS